MRTKTLLLSAAALVAGLASSVAQSNVYSVNIVGYVNTTLSGTGFTAISNPLDDGTNTLDSLLRDVLPANATVQFWNGSGFDLATRVPFGTGWSPGGLQGDTPLPPGTGVFVGGLGGAAKTNTFVGEALTGSLVNELDPGLNFIANQVPVGGNADQIGIGAVLAANDTIQKWNGSGFDVYTKIPFGSGWSFQGNPNAGPPTLNVGEGFFVGIASGNDWAQEFNPNE